MAELEIKTVLAELDDLRKKYEELKTLHDGQNKILSDIENRLLDSEVRNAALLSANPDLMFVFDKQGYFIDYNGGANEMYAPPNLFIGKRLMRFYLPVLQSLLTKRLTKSLKPERCRFTITNW